MSQNQQEQTEAKLLAYVEGDLDDAGRADIEKHLAANPNHRRLLDELGRQRSLLRWLPKESAPPDLYEAIQGQLERSVLLDGVEDDAPAAPVYRIGAWSQLRAIAAVLLLASGIAVAIFFGLKNQNNPNVAGGPTTKPTTAPTGGFAMVDRRADEHRKDAGPADRDRDADKLAAESRKNAGTFREAGKVFTEHEAAAKKGPDAGANTNLAVGGAMEKGTGNAVGQTGAPSIAATPAAPPAMTPGRGSASADSVAATPAPAPAPLARAATTPPSPTVTPAPATPAPTTPAGPDARAVSKAATDFNAKAEAAQNTMLQERLQQQVFALAERNVSQLAEVQDAVNYGNRDRNIASNSVNPSNALYVVVASQDTMAAQKEIARYLTSNGMSYENLDRNTVEEQNRYMKRAENDGARPDARAGTAPTAAKSAGNDRMDRPGASPRPEDAARMQAAQAGGGGGVANEPVQQQQIAQKLDDAYGDQPIEQVLIARGMNRRQALTLQNSFNKPSELQWAQVYDAPVADAQAASPGTAGQLAAKPASPSQEPKFGGAYAPGQAGAAPAEGARAPGAAPAKPDNLGTAPQGNAQKQRGYWNNDNTRRLDAAPAPDAKPLQKGEKIRITFRDNTQASEKPHEIAIPPSGSIQFKPLGNITCAGHTAAEVERELREAWLGYDKREALKAPGAAVVRIERVLPATDPAVLPADRVAVAAQPAAPATVPAEQQQLQRRAAMPTDLAKQQGAVEEQPVDVVIVFQRIPEAGNATGDRDANAAEQRAVPEAGKR